MFSPEFRNRLDATIQFSALSPKVVSQVVDKFVIEVEEQLADRNVTIELTKEARRWLARKGFDKVFGARPLGRVIQEHVKRPLADELLFGRLAKGGVVKVTVKDGKLEFDLKEAPKKAPKSAKPKRPKEPALVE